MKRKCNVRSKECEQASSACPLKDKSCTYENVKGFCTLDCNCAIAFRLYGLSPTRYQVPHPRNDLLFDPQADEQK